MISVAKLDPLFDKQLTHNRKVLLNICQIPRSVVSANVEGTTAFAISIPSNDQRSIIDRAFIIVIHIPPLSSRVDERRLVRVGFLGV